MDEPGVTNAKPQQTVQQPGSLLNHYRILRQLGVGGMGEVYEAEDTKLRRRVALKISRRDQLRSSQPGAVRAGGSSGRRGHHPNIVTIHSVEESGSTRFLTMEVVDGGTIDTLFLANGLPLPDLLKYALPIVDAVSAAHERGIVHRDLKPANVMVTDVPTGVGRHVFDKVC
jgi:serine/threonine protein kinase